MWLRRDRVRVHLAENHPAAPLPSLEGILLSKRGRELILAVPQLVYSTEAAPAPLESRHVAIPRERVAFYEVLR